MELIKPVYHQKMLRKGRELLSYCNLQPKNGLVVTVVVYPIFQMQNNMHSETTTGLY